VYSSTSHPSTPPLDPHRNNNLSIRNNQTDIEVDIIGVKLTTLIHSCFKCSFPILVYGRLTPCQHAVCISCAETQSACTFCHQHIDKVETISDSNFIHICSYSKCQRSYHSEYSLNEHQKLRGHGSKVASSPLPILTTVGNDPISDTLSTQTVNNIVVAPEVQPLDHMDTRAPNEATKLSTNNPSPIASSYPQYSNKHHTNVVMNDPRFIGRNSSSSYGQVIHSDRQTSHTDYPSYDYPIHDYSHDNYTQSYNTQRPEYYRPPGNYRSTPGGSMGRGNYDRNGRGKHRVQQQNSGGNYFHPYY